MVAERPVSVSVGLCRRFAAKDRQELPVPTKSAESSRETNTLVRPSLFILSLVARISLLRSAAFCHKAPSSLEPAQGGHSLDRSRPPRLPGTAASLKAVPFQKIAKQTQFAYKAICSYSLGEAFRGKQKGYAGSRLDLIKRWVACAGGAHSATQWYSQRLCRHRQKPRQISCSMSFSSAHFRHSND